MTMLSAIAAPAVANESQAPLQFDTVSKLRWEECGEISNHTLECIPYSYSMLNQADEERLPTRCPNGSLE